MSWDKELNLQQLDDALEQYRVLAQQQRPKTGWINAIRTALGMSARTLGEHIGLSQPRVALIEKGEVDGTITLNTLEKAAQGLGCRVVYSLVPEESSLHAMRKAQALKKANQLNQYSETHMELENQQTDKRFQQQHVQELAEEYLRKWPRDFWDDQ